MLKGKFPRRFIIIIIGTKWKSFLKPHWTPQSLRLPDFWRILWFLANVYVYKMLKSKIQLPIFVVACFLPKMNLFTRDDKLPLEIWTVFPIVLRVWLGFSRKIPGALEKIASLKYKFGSFEYLFYSMPHHWKGNRVRVRVDMINLRP